MLTSFECMAVISDVSEDSNLAYWVAITKLLEDALRILPHADEPDCCHWDHPDDEWKNGAALAEKEDNCWSDTDDLIRTLCVKRHWPKRSKNDARYFAEQRINWALKFIRVLMVPNNNANTAVIPRSPLGGLEFI